VSIPRLILAGVEPGPALDLVAGALLAGFGEQRTTRAILLGFDLPLWRLTYDVAARAPRALDPALYSAPVADELFDQWSEQMDLALVVGVRPLLDRWEGVNGSRAADLARRLDAPIVLALDARGRGASAAAAVYGTRALASQLEIGGVVLVGGDDSAVGLELLRAPSAGGPDPRVVGLCQRPHAALNIDDVAGDQTRNAGRPDVLDGHRLPPQHQSYSPVEPFRHWLGQLGLTLQDIPEENPWAAERARAGRRSDLGRETHFVHSSPPNSLAPAPLGAGPGGVSPLAGGGISDGTGGGRTAGAKLGDGAVGEERERGAVRRAAEGAARNQEGLGAIGGDARPCLLSLVCRRAPQGYA